MSELARAETPGAAPAADYSPPYRFPFMFGVYLATNAIPDAYAVVDGPDCLFFKAEFIHGKHDQRSTLLDVLGRHRVAATNISAAAVALSKGELVEDRLRVIGGIEDARVAFLSSLPMVGIIGTQYDQILRRMQGVGGSKALLLEVPGRSLEGDWLDGYADSLEALAARIDLSGGPATDRAKVAVVGYLCDRNEEDHQASVRELERCLAGAGLELVCVWLGNQPYERLRRVREAGTILSLPLGRRAARTLGERTGAQVVEVDLPFGSGRTQRFLRRAAKAAGRPDGAEAFIRDELARLLPRLEWVVAHTFLGRKAAFSGPPDHFGGFLQLAEEVGLEVVHLSAPCAAKWLEEDLSREFDAPPPVLAQPREGALAAELERLRRLRVDVVVGNTDLRRRGADRLGAPFVEFGFPSWYHHALHARPTVGFQGWMALLDRLANALTAPPRDGGSPREASA